MIKDHVDSSVTPLSGALRALLSQHAAPTPDAAELDMLLQGVHPAISDGAAALLREDGPTAPFTDHAWIYRQGNAPERLAFYALSRLLDPAASTRRERLLDALWGAPTGSPLDDVRLDPAAAIFACRPQGWSVLDEALDEATQAFSSPDARTDTLNPAKAFMSTVRLPVPFFASKTLALARHPSVLRLVGEYLGGYPILFRINLLRSSNEYMQDGSSQFFHIDPEDFRQVKIFLLAGDVEEDSGPLHLLRADATDEYRVRTGYRHGRLTDDAVFSVVGRENLVQCVGERGTMIFGDTSRCLHFGSRPGNRERFVVMIQYLTPFAASFPLVPARVAGKYADAFQDLCLKEGRTRTEEDECLFGVKR